MNRTVLLAGIAVLLIVLGLIALGYVSRHNEVTRMEQNDG